MPAASPPTTACRLSTIDEALAAGIEPKDVWKAVCAEFEMPGSLT
jgi:hypothetical protein